MQTLRDYLKFLLCPYFKLLAGRTSSAAAEEKSWWDRHRLHVPLMNTLTSTIILSRPFTVLAMVLWALGGTILSIFTSLTGWQPFAECRTHEPRTRPRPPRGEDRGDGRRRKEAEVILSTLSRSIASSSKGWLGLGGAPLSPTRRQSLPHGTVRLAMTFHDLEGVKEYKEDEEEKEVESIGLEDRESESEGSSEVDTLSSIAPVEAALKHKGIFRWRGKRGSSDSSFEGVQGDGASIDKSRSGSSSASSESLGPRPRTEHRLWKATRNLPPPSPSGSSSFSSPTTYPTSTSLWQTNPFVRYPPLLPSHSFPPLHGTEEPESYILPPGTTQSLVLPVSPDRRHGLSLFMANSFRKSHVRDPSPLLALPPFFPRIPSPPESTVLTYGAPLASKTEGRLRRAESPDSSGESGLDMSDVLASTHQ